MPNKVYYKLVLGANGAPFAPSDYSFTSNTTRSILNSLIKFLDMQIMGGSTTVPDSYEKLRLAGAVARETLKAADSQKTGIAVSELKTSGGMVVTPNGTKISYQELASIAATLDPAEEVTARPKHVATCRTTNSAC